MTEGPPRRPRAPSRPVRSGTTRAPRSGVRRRRAAVVATFLVVMVVLVAIPGRGYLAQRGDVASAEAGLKALEQENAGLQRRRDRLGDPGQVQRIARRDYGLVALGEESYSILPPATAGLVLPRAWPFDRISDAVRRASAGP